MREAFLNTNCCKIHRQYFLKLFFLHFEYFQIRQLENLGAKRRTPLARNFSHFKKKESEVFRDLANPQFFQYLCTAISNPVSKSVFCYKPPLKRRWQPHKTNIEGKTDFVFWKWFKIFNLLICISYVHLHHRRKLAKTFEIQRLSISWSISAAYTLMYKM